MSIKLVGKDNTSGSSEDAGYLLLNKCTAVASGTMSLFYIRCNVASNVKVGIYADNDGDPGALLNSVGSTAISAGWVSIAFPETAIVKDTVYWLAINIDTFGGVAQSTGEGLLKFKLYTYADAFPDPAGTGYTLYQFAYCDHIAGWGFINATVSAVLATATAQGYDPTIIAEIYVTVSVVLAAADSAAGVPAVIAGQGTDSSPPLIAATAEAPIPEILAGDCVIAAALATASALALEPAASISEINDVPLGEATAVFPAPTIAFDSVISAEVATADVGVLEPDIYFDYAVSSSLATAAAEGLEPAISISESNDVLQGEATAEFPAPECFIGTIINVSAPAVSAAEALDPALLLDYILLPPAASIGAAIPEPEIIIAEDNESIQLRADAELLVPTISILEDNEVPLVEAGAEFPEPTVSIEKSNESTQLRADAEILAPQIEISCTIADALSIASADQAVPSIIAEFNIAIATEAATATAAIPAPEFGLCKVEPPPAEAAAAQVVPSLLVAADSVTAGATGVVLSPVIIGSALITPPTATALAVAEIPSPVPTVLIIQTGTYSDMSQEINRVFVIGVDAADLPVTAIDEADI